MRAPPCSSDPKKLLDASVLDDPHPFLSVVRREHPLSRVGDTGVHLVATWDGILEVLGREEDFSANLTGMLIRGADGVPIPFDFPSLDGTQVIATADEPHHTVHRRLVSPRFETDRVVDFEPMIREWTREALAPFLLDEGGEFVPIAERIPAQVVGSLLGLPDGDAERHRAWAMMGGDMLAGEVGPTRMQALALEGQKMGHYLKRHLEAASKAAPDPSRASLLELLAEGVRAGEITLSQATGIGMVMFGAGGESTSALIGSAMRVLAEEPELAEQLRQDPLQIARFVEEVVRLEPPFKFHYRAVRRECELQGYTLGPGDRLMLLWAAANRDPAVFEEPDALRLDRKHPKHHMSFGRGAHFCVGAPLARLEARVMVEEVLRETRQLSLVPGHPPVYAQSIFTRRLESLVVSTRKIA